MQDGPVFAAKIGGELVTIFGAVLERAGKLRVDTPLLCVPAILSCKVDRLVMEVVVLGIDARKRQSAQDQEQSFPLRSGKAVSFLSAKNDVELIIVPGP